MIDEHKMADVARGVAKLIYEGTKSTAEILFVLALINQATTSAINAQDVEKHLVKGFDKP